MGRLQSKYTLDLGNGNSVRIKIGRRKAEQLVDKLETQIIGGSKSVMKASELIDAQIAILRDAIEDEDVVEKILAASDDDLEILDIAMVKIAAICTMMPENTIRAIAQVESEALLKKALGLLADQEASTGSG